MQEHEKDLFEYLLRLGDTTCILSHRLSEWCGHAPAIEEDVALINIALDLIGQTRMYLDYAGRIEGAGRDEDALAYLRDAMDYRNLLLVEQPNGDFAQTIMRQFLFDAQHLPLLEALTGSSDAGLAEIAAKAVREVRYHLRHSSQWVIRLGDGTEESHERIANALEYLWRYTGEMFTDDVLSRRLADRGVAPLPSSLREAWLANIDPVLEEATLSRPADGWMQTGGREGHHTEHLGYILAEMQFLPRAYPDARW